MDFCGTEVTVWEDTTDIAKIDQAISDVNARIKEIKKGGILEHEKPILKNLREQGASLKKKRKSCYARKICNYPMIDMQFLSKHRVIQTRIRGDCIHIPVFGIFRVYPGKWARFGFARTKNDYGKDMASRAEWRIDQNSGNGKRVWKLPEVFHQHFDKIPASTDSGIFGTSRFGLRLEREVISTTFNSAVPADVKSEIAKAYKIFGKDLYFVAEIPQEKWKKDDVPLDPDPLVVGVIDETAYLIAKFDATPVEDYVSREFTTGPLPQAKKVEDNDD